LPLHPLCSPKASGPSSQNPQQEWQSYQCPPESNISTDPQGHFVHCSITSGALTVQLLVAYTTSARQENTTWPNKLAATIDLKTIDILIGDLNHQPIKPHKQWADPESSKVSTLTAAETLTGQCASPPKQISTKQNKNTPPEAWLSNSLNFSLSVIANSPYISHPTHPAPPNLQSLCIQAHQEINMQATP